MPNIRDEVVNLAIKYSHYKSVWENRFEDLKKAHDTGYMEFTKHLPQAQKTMPKDLVEDIGEMGANMVVAHMSLSGGPAVVAVPIVLGVKKLIGLLVPDLNLPSVDVTAVKKSLDDIKKAFRDATEHMGYLITQLHDKVIRLSDNAHSINDDGFRRIKETMSKILLSPLWFPPAPGATDPIHMDRPFEMRMWFMYWKYLDGLGESMMKFDLRPMFSHLKDYSWQPSGHNWDAINYALSERGRAGQQILGYGEWAGPLDYKMVYKPAIKFLLAHVQKNNSWSLKIRHKFPQEVEGYLQRVQVLRGITMDGPSDHLLAPATMTWADVVGWNPNP